MIVSRSVERLSARIDLATPLSFDKDDDDTLDFVVAAANLRASAFDIESQTRFQVKGMSMYLANSYPGDSLMLKLSQSTPETSSLLSPPPTLS